MHGEESGVHCRGGVCVAKGGIHGERGTCVAKEGMGGEGECMVKEGAWVVKGVSMTGGAHGWWRGAYMVRGVCGIGLCVVGTCMAEGSCVHDRRPLKLSVHILLEYILVN